MPIYIVEMTLALCMIKCDYQSVKNTLQSIKRVKGVIESHETTGPDDAVLKVKAESEAELRSIVRNLGMISGVFAILTAIVYNVK
jgi:DNA-binding Lrp family transcriptional regulator